MPPNTKGSKPTLIRVRDNQRRSRARKREYVADLEKRLQECQTNGPSAKAIVTPDIARQLEEENRKLRELLVIAGIDQTSIDAHLNNGNDGLISSSGEVCNGSQPCNSTNIRESAQIVPPTMVAGIVPECIRGTTSDLEQIVDSSNLELFDQDFDPSIFDFDFSFPEATGKEPTLPAGDEITAFETLASAYSLAPEVQQPPICPSTHILPLSTCPDDETTLCSVAYDMIRQRNQKGVDMIDIGIRLWNGFSKGEGGSGCKVDNKLLFSVLESISS